jgi:hypothetical protein
MFAWALFVTEHRHAFVLDYGARKMLDVYEETMRNRTTTTNHSEAGE